MHINSILINKIRGIAWHNYALIALLANYNWKNCIDFYFIKILKRTFILNALLFSRENKAVDTFLTFSSIVRNRVIFSIHFRVFIMCILIFRKIKNKTTLKRTLLGPRMQSDLLRAASCLINWSRFMLFYCFPIQDNLRF